jgi:hypothetical protein
VAVGKNIRARLPRRSFSEDGPRLKSQISSLKSSINKSLSYYTRMQYTVMQHSEKLVPLCLLKKSRLRRIPQILNVKSSILNLK